MTSSSSAEHAASASSRSAAPPAGGVAVVVVGLGRMGGNMARRLSRHGISVHGYDSGTPVPEVAADGVRLHATLADAVAALPADRPRMVWLMLPHGPITDGAVDQLMTLLAPGDLIIDGGNSNYHASQALGQRLTQARLLFMDCGVSGGVWGLQNGYCLMFGGEPAAMRLAEPLARALAPGRDGSGDDAARVDTVADSDFEHARNGWLHCGPIGSGHFTKMVHNGIEYGMMQALAEGFALLAGKSEFDLDLAAIGELWRHGSVVRSWLLDLTADALARPGALDSVAPVVADSGEGRWTVDEAIRQGTPTPVIALALMSRFDSQGKADVANKLLALMRQGFGGHAITHSDKP